MLQLNQLPANVFILTLNFYEMFCGYCVTVPYSSLKNLYCQKKFDRKVAILKQKGENISIIPGNHS